MPDRIGELASMEGYSPEEADFQFGVRATPWFGEFAQQHGEPNLNDPNYDYRAAWTAGARPNVRNPGDNQYHWPSQFKGAEHPNRYVNGVDTITGQPVSTGEEYAGLGGDPRYIANAIKDWWKRQPSWLSRAQAENQKTTEAFQRGGMGEIAKQLATDTTEPQELYGAFGVGNVARVPRSFTTVRGPIGGSDPNYVYHATSAERAGDISESGLQTYKPHEFTDQGLWPDRSAEKRNYFTPTSENTWQFAPEEGNPVLLRVKKDTHDFKRETTGDIYSTQSVPASKIEYLDQSGKWLPLSDTAPGELAALDQYRPPFYSAVEQAVQGAKQNAAPGQQWAGFLRNQPGVKPEEVEALGLGKLFEQPGAVPKQAVLGEIAANRVNVGEVIKFERSQQPAAQRVNLIDEQLNVIQGEFDRLHRRSDGSPIDTAAARERRATLAAQERELRIERAGIVANWQERSSGDTKFQQYTLPGGENYREMLLTLPGKSKYDEFLKSMSQKYGGELEFRQAATDAERNQLQQFAQEDKQHFRSSHYEEPNILAHVRYNDRVIDGKKTLFVEEVQSDWHQKGKRQGYKEGEPQTIPSFTADQLKIHETEHQYVGTTPDGRQQVVGKGTVGDEDGAREYLTRYMNKMAAERNMSAVQAHQAKVPDAPFKTTWPELAMKRIIREAAEKGYDKVAWTPGSVQAARYPEQLRQHVDEIAWSSPGTARSNPEGLRYVHAKPRAGGMDLVFTVNKDGMITEASAAQAKGQHVEDIFGKDMSRQIMEKVEGEIASKDFVIGAKGQQGFYDEILPNVVNKLVKKHGGRVTQADMTAATAASPERVHSLDITPSLRAAAMKGFPLFSAGGVAATGIMGEMARQDEYR